jgi:serine/threonine-protein kinase
MIGDRLGSWNIESELGRGGMGCVYLARDDNEHLAAVKVLAGELSTQPGAVNRFQREIEALRRLDHPNIVRFFESGTHQGLLYFVMEYVEGRNYAELLIAQRRLPWPEVLDMAVQVCAALKHAHNQGIIHRDIKPSNLLRKADGQVKLTDFGVAHVFDAEQLTRTGTVVGTAEYLSPEQAAGKPASKRSDLYSLGVVLYTLLAGRTPFQGSSPLELMHKHCYARFDPLGKLIPNLPHDMEILVDELLEKDPEHRPPDAGTLEKRLEVMRRKLQRRSKLPRTEIRTGPTQSEIPQPTPTEHTAHVEGPATLMSRLVRRELEAQIRGGPLKQFFNRPVVIVTLFLLCIGILGWTFWPDSPESLFSKGQALMEAEPSGWEEAWEKYLEPLQRKYPDNPHRDQVARYRQQLEEHRDQRARARQGDSGPLGEAQWFYHQGLRQRQQGNEAAARTTWLNLVRVFQGVPAERHWVRLAQGELLRKETSPADAHRWTSVRTAMEQARRLRAEGKPVEAQAVLTAVEQLYRNDPSARDILDALRREQSNR